MAAQAVSERGQDSSRMTGQQDGYQQQQQQNPYVSENQNIQGRDRPVPRSRPDNGPLGIGRLLQQVFPLFSLFCRQFRANASLESPLFNGSQHTDRGRARTSTGTV